MERKKRTKVINVGETHLTQLLFGILFIAIFLLIMYLFSILNIRKPTNVLYNAERGSYDLSAKKDKDNIFIQDHWIFIPNMKKEDIKSYLNIADYKLKPHVSDVSITGSGWDDLGEKATWHCTDSSIPKFEPFMNDGMRMISGAYMTKLTLNGDITNLYLDLGKINGHAFVYCNGFLLGNVGDSTKFKVLPEFSGGYNSVALTNNNNNIELVILIYSNQQTTRSGLNTTPALFYDNDNALFATLPTAFLSVTAFMTIVAIIGGYLLRKTFSDSKIFSFFALTILFTLFYIIINSNYLQFATPYRSILEFLCLTLAVTFSYSFVSFLFTRERANHKFANLDSIVITCCAMMFISLAFLDSRLLSTSFERTTIFLFVIVVTAMSLFKVIFFYIDAKNSTIGICAAISMFFVFFNMLISDNLLSNCPLYAIYYVLSLLALIIYFIQRYIVQYSELIHSSEHLRNVVEEKTMHISMINKDLLNTNKKLLENEEARKNVMSNVSHDLRTPITAIRGYSELLLQNGQALSEEQKAVYLQNIVKRSQQMERIIADIVEISKMESNGFKFEFMDVSLNELLDELYMLYSSDMRNGKKKIVLDVPDDDLLITKADPKRISRVFENLISNAINYTKEEALITIKAWRENEDLPLSEQKLHITVSDDGIGIPPESIPHIFDRFYRAKNSGQNVKGTGLGLSIVKMIVDKHDAEISVESTLGEGTTFHVIMKPTY